MSSEFVPEIWSQKMLAEFQKNLALKTVMEESTIVLNLGPNIGLTTAQVNAAIADEGTDPIIRNALIAFKAKMRIADTPPERIRVDKIYGYGKYRP